MPNTLHRRPRTPSCSLLSHHTGPPTRLTPGSNRAFPTTPLAAPPSAARTRALEELLPTFADGSDDIGKVRRLSRKKSHQGAQQQRSELSLFQSVGPSSPGGRDRERQGRQPHAWVHGPRPQGSERRCGPKTARAKRQKRTFSDPQETDPFHRPPLRCQAGAGTKGDNRNPADKSLLAENYRHNVVGYTGHQVRTKY